jgi:hypothetical protein
MLNVQSLVSKTVLDQDKGFYGDVSWLEAAVYFRLIS